MNNTHATLLDNPKPGSLPALPRSVNVCAIPVGEPTPAISTTVTTSISSEPKDAKTARPIESAIRCIEESIMPNDAEGINWHNIAVIFHATIFKWVSLHTNGN